MPDCLCGFSKDNFRCNASEIEFLPWPINLSLAYLCKSELIRLIREASFEAHNRVMPIMVCAQFGRAEDGAHFWRSKGSTLRHSEVKTTEDSGTKWGLIKSTGDIIQYKRVS